MRGYREEELGALRVVGSVTGGHSGLHSDGRKVSFLPDARFEPGETVTVSADIALIPSGDGSLSFEADRPARMTRSPDVRVTNDPAVEPHVFRSRPDLRPPVMRLTEPANGTADGLIFNGRFPAGRTSYRVYRFPWVGEPTEPPAVAAERGAADTVIVYASWNGATEVATWRVLAGPAADQLVQAGTASRDGFETAIEVTSGEPWIAVEALDAGGAVLGASDEIEV